METREERNPSEGHPRKATDIGSELEHTMETLPSNWAEFSEDDVRHVDEAPKLRDHPDNPSLILGGPIA